MSDTTEIEEGEAGGCEPPRGRLLMRRAGRVLRVVYFSTAGGLWLAYLVPGDLYWWSSMATVFPPLLWLLPLGALGAMACLEASRRLILLVAVTLAVFALTLEEWRPLLRPLAGGANEHADSIKLLSWNTSAAPSSRLLEELARHEPDICFIQESPDGRDSIAEVELTGHFEGFHALDAGDCAVLSRWPLERLASKPVGPWEDPLMARAILPDGQGVVLCSVRLMLPALLLNPLSRAERAHMRREHDARIGQYEKLTSLLRDAAGTQPILLAGDFNCVAGSKSLSVLDSLTRDAWSSVGRGWGRTITADFPAARIDQVRHSPQWIATDAYTFGSPHSDHRGVVAELVPRPSEQ